jgi:aminopeptidase-like protein
MAYLWILNQADGSKTLLDIAERAGLPFDVLLEAALGLQRAELIIDAAEISGETI